ncbi:hypothetical protein C8A01DRAFT_48253 [Parachaetomium inaequale]|uniref:Uncharacterized protein n=1 Tax=Parachaetomium inaequale TaxID=2588326 RepID=A0AAN6SQ59_9PEZI|nr:hypothetical protein C8A01DRAFT_48253 [Parachaetomium inaequale]
MSRQQHPPSIQLISKSDFTTQHIIPVSLPAPLPPLTPGSNQALIRTHTIALTTNNFTYARRGGIPFLGWWDVWPMPAASSLPAPFNDPSVLAGYCRIPAWGYSVVVESAVPGLAVGTMLFGVQPVGTLAEVVELDRAGEDVDGHWIEVGKRRAGLNGVYNRYMVRDCTDDDKEGRGWDAVMGVLFQTGDLMNRFVFAWEEGVPAGHPLGDERLPWTEEDADLAGAVVVILAASGKTALCFARELRAGRPKEKQPSKVVAVGSEFSRAFTTGTGLFDEVLLYSDWEDETLDLGAELGGEQGKVVLLDFGARGDAVDRWAKVLEGKCKRLQALVVGGDPMAKERSEMAKRTQDPMSGVAQVFAGGMRDRAIGIVGAAKYFAHQEAAWAKFKADGGVQGLHLKWGEGLDDFSRGWDALDRGEHGPDVGLVYEFPVEV